MIKYPAPPRDIHFRQCYGCGVETGGDVLCADCRQDPAYRDGAIFYDAPAIECGGETSRPAGDAPAAGDDVGRLWRALALAIAWGIAGGVILGGALAFTAIAWRVLEAGRHLWHAIFGG